MSEAGAATPRDEPPASVAATLVPVSGNGLSTTFRDTLLSLDRHELLLAIGRHIVLQNTLTQELTFLSGQQSPQLQQQALSTLGEITAMALCGKRQYLSVCRAAVNADEYGGGTLSAPASISIYHLGAASAPPQQFAIGSTRNEAAAPGKRGSSRRVQLLKTLSVPWAERFNGTALSPDGKLVSAQAANSSWSLGVWDWGRGRQVALSDVHCRVSRVRFNAIDMAQLSTSGGNLLRIWTLCEYALKPLASFKSGDEAKSKHGVNYADHAWLPDDVLVALLEDGDVQLVVNAELVQTLRAVHKGLGRLLCITALSNGEDIVIGGTHGFVSLVRLTAKAPRSTEKELVLQHRLRLRGVERVANLAADPSAATLFYCTERGYGAYELSQLGLLHEDDEPVTLHLLASTPLSHQMERLSAASRRGCFAAACKLPDGDAAVHVWNQADCHECFIAHPLEQQSPLSLDMHPGGSELLLTFATKLQVLFVLQDSLRLAFELPQKQLSLARYSPSGALFAASQTTNRTVFLYRSCSRAQREPQLVGVFRDLLDAVVFFRWAVHDSSFFVADASGELRHCQLGWQTGGEVEDLVDTHSTAHVLTRDNTIVAATSCHLDRDSHGYVLFLVERKTPPTSYATRARSGGGNGCVLRAWVNGELSHDALRTSGRGVGSDVAFEITSLEAGPGLSTGSSGSGGSISLLFAGTANGAVVIFSWKRASRAKEGQPSLQLQISAAVRRVDLHTAPVAGLFYSVRSRTLLSNARNGVVLACTLCREVNPASSSANAGGSSSTAALRDEQNFLDASASAFGFTSVCQPEELALYDRSKVDLARLKLLDVEGELQQLKLENEMLRRQADEQSARFEATLQESLAARAHAAEQERRELRASLDAELGGAIDERNAKLRALTEDARAAQDHYLMTMEKLQREGDSLREQLQATQLDLEDEQKRARKREAQLEAEGQQQLLEERQRHEEALLEAKEEAALVRRQLQEVLRQQDQDQLAQMGLLASSVEREKRRNAQQLADEHGKAAALNQEVKMLLGALTQKDGELQHMSEECEERQRESSALKARLADERALSKRLAQEKEESVAQLAEQRRTLENLQRLDSVHRSQLELLQKHLVPKDRELAQMQAHLTQLHDANQEVVVQANLSDRLRVESSSQAKRHERELLAAHKRLERVRHSIVVLQEELGELVRRSAAQEKSTLVTEIGRLHKRLTRQLDALQARDDGGEEVNAELHRQNRFLLQNKHALRRQVEAGNREKHKLAAALSFQNAALLGELNTLRRNNKELERRLKRQGELAPHSEETASARTEASAGVEVPETDEEAAGGFDGRQLLKPSASTRGISPATSALVNSTQQFLTGRRASGVRTTGRPNSAAAATPLRRRPSTAGAGGRTRAGLHM